MDNTTSFFPKKEIFRNLFHHNLSRGLTFSINKTPKKFNRLQGSLLENHTTLLLPGPLSTRQNLCVDFHEFVFQQKAFHRFFLSALLLERTQRNTAFKHLILSTFREKELSILSPTKAQVQKADLLQARPTR